MAILKNEPEFRSCRTRLRKNLTPAEALLWTHLKGSRLDGRKFLRQHGVGKYVVAFYCPAERLGVELDGRDNFSESDAQEDSKRRRFIEALEIRVIRFDGNLIFENPEFVVDEIKANFGWRRQEGILPRERGTHPSTRSEEVRSNKQKGEFHDSLFFMDKNRTTFDRQASLPQDSAAHNSPEKLISIKDS